MRSPVPMTRFRLLAPAVAVLLAAPIAGAVQTRRGPLGSIRILGGPVITMDERATDGEAFTAVSRVLEAAGVRYVLESPVPDQSEPQFDLAAPQADSMILTGLTVGDALDRVAKETSRFAWKESDGVIVARFTTTSASVLDQRLSRFSVTGANARAAMGALVSLLAPEWDQAARIGIRARSINPLSPTPPPDVSNAVVSVNMRNETVVDVLARLARESRSWSWTIRYERAPGVLDNASVLLYSGRDAIAATGPRVPDPTPPGTLSPFNIRLTNDLWSALASYVRVANVTLSYEQGRGYTATPGALQSGYIDVTGLKPAEAIARIVAHDSRYAWQERGGRFVVYPKVGSQSVLDTPLPSFVRISEPFIDVLGDLLGRIGQATVRPSRPPGDRFQAEAEERLRRPVTIELREPTTLRVAIDQLCAAFGSASWSFGGGSSPNGQAQYGISIQTSDGGSTTRAFSIPEAAGPSRPPEYVLPAELDRDLTRLYPTGSGVSPQYFALAAAARVPIGLEMRPLRGFDSDPRWSRNLPPYLPLGPGKFSDLLYMLLERDPGVHLRVRNGVVNLAPATTWAMTNHFLDRPLGRFVAEAMPVWQVGVQLRQRLNPGGPTGSAASLQPPDFGVGRASDWSKIVTITLDNPTARDVLNALATAHGNLGWTMRYEHPQPGRDAEVREEHAVLVLSILSDLTSAGLQYARDGSMTITRPASRTPGSAFSTGQPGVGPRRPLPVLSLPLFGRGDSGIDRVCLGLGVRCLFELVSDRVRPVTISQPVEGTYDFSGMAVSDAMNKILELVPGLTWKLEGEFYRFRSVGIESFGELPLDRRIPLFEHDLPNIAAIRDAAAWLLRGSDARLPTFATPPPASSVRPTGAPEARPFTVRLENATVREIFDAIARANPDITWGVHYLNANGTVPQVEFRLNERNSATSATVALPGKR